MLKCECNEKHARLECEPLPNGMTLVRVYEDEQEVTREAVSNMDTPWHGYSYTTYETVTQMPDGQVDVDAWAALVKQADYDTAAAAVRAERDKLIAATDWTVLGDAKTVNDVVQTGFKKEDKILTLLTLHSGSLLVKVAELSFKKSVGVLYFLLLLELGTVL